MHLVDLAHLFFSFFPIIIYFIDFPNSIVQIMFLIFTLMPLSWAYYGNRCMLTTLGALLSNKKEEKNFKNFGEKYMEPFNYGITKLVGLPWNKKSHRKAEHIHWFVNLILVWYYLFVYKCECTFH